MYSSAERAAFAALLARARANEEITENEIEAILPPDIAARVIAVSIERENAIIDRYDEEVWANWRIYPDTIEFYKDQLRLLKKEFKAAPAKLVKLMPKGSANSVFKRQVNVLANAKPTLWNLYNELSDTDKLWTKPDSKEDGWPPELVDEPPMKVVLPDVELPTAYALRRVLSEELGVDP